MSSKNNSGNSKDEPIDIAAMEDTENRLKAIGHDPASAILVDDLPCEESNNHHLGESKELDPKKDKDGEQLDSSADNVAVKEEPVKKTTDNKNSDSSANNVDVKKEPGDVAVKKEPGEVAVKEEPGALTVGKNSVKIETMENTKSNKIKRQKTDDGKQPLQPRTINLARSGTVCSVQAYAKKHKLTYKKVNERDTFQKLLPEIVMFGTQVPGWKWNCIDQLQLNDYNTKVASDLCMVIYEYLTWKEQENLSRDTLEQASEQKDKGNSSADMLKQAYIAGTVEPWQKLLPVVCCGIIFLWHVKRKCFYKEHLTYLCGNSDRVDNLIQVLKVLQKPIQNEEGFKYVPDGKDTIGNTFINTFKVNHNKTVYGFGPVVRKLITNSTRDVFDNETEYFGLSTLPYASRDYVKILRKLSYFLKLLDGKRYNSLIDEDSETGTPDKHGLTVVETDDQFKSPDSIEDLLLNIADPNGENIANDSSKMHDPEQEGNIDSLNMNVPNHEENTEVELNMFNSNSMSDDDDGDYELVTTDQSHTSNDDGEENKDLIYEL